MPDADTPRRNHLLAALSAEEYDRVHPNLELVQMRLGHVLHESGGIMSHVYFPTTAVVSILNVTDDGASTEIALVGNEGIVGVALFMGGETTLNRALVQSAGFGYRMQGQFLKNEFFRADSLQGLLLRYTQALLIQMSQTAACNRHHSLDQQLCRWLLLTLDRLSCNQIKMTQQLIANMLGVPNEGVTEAVEKLQSAGLIEYQRGWIKVLDRGGLEDRVCECYDVIKKEYGRLFPEFIIAASPTRPRIALTLKPPIAEQARRHR